MELQTYISLLFSIIVSFTVIGESDTSTAVYKRYISVQYENQYGDGYGTDWIYFPDGEGHPIFVNFTATSNLLGKHKVPSDLEIQFYTRTVDGVILLDENGKIYNETVNVTFDGPIKVVTHGWKSTAESSAVKSIKDAYVEKGVNVITIDWGYVANSIFYNWVANETKSIGTQIAVLLDGLNEHHKVSGDQIHLIGHSLGAHVMGVAGYFTKLKIDRITGLDPARPLFEYPSRDDTERLDIHDANFVDVIHTCGGVLGVDGAIGTADFYPNGGIPPQPGCGSIQKILEACSHSRAHDYFTESIKRPKAFPAFQCESWINYQQNRCGQFGFMGESVNRSVTGKLFLKTNSDQPYGRNFEPFCLFG